MRKPLIQMMTAAILCLTVFVFMSCETDSSTNGGNGGNGNNTTQLTMSVNPVEGGTTDPAEGSHTVYIDSVQTITATPAAGYAFSYWSATENAVIADSSAASTTVTLTGNAEVTANFELVNPDNLVGVWNAVSATVTFIITTNSDQTVVDVVSPCNGTIAATGAETATLAYMTEMEMEGEPAVIASDVSLLDLLVESGGFAKTVTVQNKQIPIPTLKTNLDYPVHILVHILAGLDLFMVLTGPTNTTAYLGAGVTYNSNSKTLAADNVTLLLPEFPFPSVTLNGQMQNITVDVPANTPTAVATMPLPEESSWILDVQANGTFTGIMDFGMGDGPDTTAGTWEVTSENHLTIVDTVSNDTIYATYAFSGNDLILTVDNPNEYDEDFLGLIEFLGIEEESLIDLIMQAVATFVKL